MGIKVFTDGSATTADKPGGWAYVIVINDTFHSEDSGHMVGATNNDAEMEAAIQGLSAVQKFIMDKTTTLDEFYDQIYGVTLCSDSQLILGWTSGQYHFKQQNKIEKYKELQLLATCLHVKTEWIKGHNGHEWNERCDYLANQARLGLQKEKKKEEIKNTGEGTLIGRKRDSVFCVYFDGKLKIVDFSQNICEDYNRELHGKRGSAIEIRKEKMR